MKDHDNSWMKMISKEICISKIVLIMKLFLQMFWEKFLISFKIMIGCHPQLNKSIAFCCHKSLNAFGIPFPTEVVPPEWALIWICLIIISTIQILEWMRTQFALFGFKSWELVLELALQHYAKWWWCSDLWKPLHFMHLDSWILHRNVTCFHFQQFLHWETLGFMFAVTNFIQLVSPQPVDWFSQTKLHWKAPNEGYPHMCRMHKSDNKWLRYQVINSCKSFIC